MSYFQRKSIEGSGRAFPMHPEEEEPPFNRITKIGVNVAVKQLSLPERDIKLLKLTF